MSEDSDLYGIQTQEGQNFTIVPPTGNAKHVLGICCHLAINSLCPHFLFDGSFRRLVSIDNYVGRSDSLEFSR